MAINRLDHIDRLHCASLEEMASYTPASLVGLAEELAPHYIRQYCIDPPMDSMDSAKATHRQPYAERVLHNLDHPYFLIMTWEGGIINKWEAFAEFKYSPETDSYTFSHYWRKERNVIAQSIP